MPVELCLLSIGAAVTKSIHVSISTSFICTYLSTGGAVSLMALNGLFVLMTKYNLDYPAFYDKLYMTMSNEVFDTKYKARFFYLLDKFLQSMYAIYICI